MSELTCTNTPVSTETGFHKRHWKSMRFFFARRAFESKLECILRAAYGHEGNALPAGDHKYELLSNEADSICTEFAGRWGLNADLLKAQIPGLAKLEGLAVPPPPKNYARLAWFEDLVANGLWDARSVVTNRYLDPAVELIRDLSRNVATVAPASPGDLGDPAVSTDLS